ncbi:hypothetical protein [Marinobacter qingdaonensis]|uniref:Uncharacterized protein n=1 Tax=Marinobacter qingdaonensis TaxID=3108486 RepID=A0ABU5NUL6_9GAMM|nr:hypothetical protein [Marinobacter sp. ASW11-75]MEA1079505.1 hypothetical protein [Marinobacter sp. ASW11-75]
MIITRNYRSEVDAAKHDANLAGEKIDFTLQSDRIETDFEVLDLACRFSQTAITSDGVQTDFRKVDRIGGAKLLVNAARTVYEHDRAAKNLAYAISKEWKVSFFRDDFDALESEVPRAAFLKVKEAIMITEGRVRSFHLPMIDGESVEDYRTIKNSVFDNSDKLIVLNGGMATYKTTALRDIYTEARARRMFPVMVTGKRSIASNFFSSDHEDHYKNSSAEAPQGLIGVINTVAQHKHAEDRKNCRVLIIDEVQDLFDHMATGTLGSSFYDRAAAMNALEKMMKQADRVVVADAMITDQTLSQLYSMTGAFPRVLTAQSSTDVEIKISKESEVLALAKEDLNAGKKVAVFCDYRAEGFSEIANALRTSNRAVTELTADYLERKGKTVEDINEILEAADAAVISPVINSGASIELEDYDRVYVLAGQTLNATSILQSVRRFRAARTAFIGFRRGQASKRLIKADEIIYSDLIKTASNPGAETQKLFEHKGARFLARHAASRNTQFESFKQTVIIAAEQMGFTVTRADVDVKKRKDGTAAKAAGRKKNAEIQEETAFEASRMRRAGKVTEIDMGGETKTFKQEVAARTIDALNVLELKELCEQTYTEVFGLNADLIVLKRKQLSAARIDAADGRVPTRSSIAAYAAAQFLAQAGFDFKKPFQSVITKASAEAAFEALANPIELESGHAVRAMALVKLVFSSVDFGKKYKTQIVKECIRTLGYDMEAQGQVDKQTQYGVTALYKKLNKELVNVTEIVDKYAPMMVSLNSLSEPVVAALDPVSKDEEAELIQASLIRFEELRASA